MKQKTDIFKNHFPFQCTHIKNGGKLPNFSYKTEKRLASFHMRYDDIPPIIKNLNVDKPHGWDQLPIKIIKACRNSISCPIEAYI